MNSNLSDVSPVNAEFSVRIVVCDHYLAKPVPGIDVIYSDFRGSDIKQVPVLRIFGPTPEGRKACLHIHGVFPYFYIPCPSSNPEPQYMYQIAASLDKALNIALKQATSANQHVYKISLVKGLPIYGYHDKEHLFLKIFLYSPSLIKQAAELCINGAILGQTLQPHESHLNFTLQFFIDFNLFGMSYIDLQTVKFRKACPNSFDPLDEALKPESSCYYEADCIASHIINRQRVGKGDGIENPGLEEVWNQEIERRKQLNLSLASKSLSQTRVDEETDSHYKYQQMFKIKMSNLLDKPVDVNQGTRSVKEVYPAERLEGTQLFDAADVSVHVPQTNSFSERREFDETLTGGDETIVDETLALNCSLHHSQVILNSEDLELLDILQDMDEKPVDNDSVMGTPADEQGVGDDDDDEQYSQAYNDETVYLEQQSKDATEDSEAWNDSFWDGVNIPQLDGTMDDEHVKKVRKRKMRPLRLGLSKPKNKKDTETTETEKDLTKDLSDVDEINVSREIVDDISNLHLRRANKDRDTLYAKDKDSVYTKNRDSLYTKDKVDTSDSKCDIDISIQDLVNKVSKKTNIGPAEVYDMNNEFIPQAGPSVVKNDVNNDRSNNDMISLDNDMITDHNHSDSINNTGIMSFYTSKLFDLSDEQLIVNESENHGIIDNIKVYTPKIKPPTKKYILNTLNNYKLSETVNIEPHYSNYKDVGDKIEIGQIVLKLQSKLARDQKPFERVLNTTTIEEWRQLLFIQNNDSNETKSDVLKNLLAGNRSCILEPIKRPPTSLKVKQWNDNENVSIKHEVSNIIDDMDNSQALGLNEDVIDNSFEENKEQPNLDNSLQVTMQCDGSFLCFNSNQETSSIDTAFVDTNFLTLMLVEVQTSIRGDFHPDPKHDSIQAIFIKITNDCPKTHFLEQNITQILVIDNNSDYLKRCIFEYKVTYFNNEMDLLEKLINIVRSNDPDILCGYEIELNSWGYVLERSQILGIDIVKEISRITEKCRQRKFREDGDFEGRIIGRVMFNVWRLFRHELALSSYSFECCMFEVLKERVPKYSYAQLGEWWTDISKVRRWVTVEYHLMRLNGTVRMLDKLDIIKRTCELARLFGLQWWEVLSRGSQFRVESLLLRAARPLNLLAVSPSVAQRAKMPAPECLPLIFEPESRYYTNPVIVLDFQSLYPSMMIAYNYCFSTCIGRVQNITGDAAYDFGAWKLRIPKTKLEALVNNGLVHWSPVGVGFVNPSVRRGVLPALLRRILAARQAVKKNMKLQTDENVKRAMHSRQLGLKLIANVTYGYTAANFSGRMPCVEVGDSVVASGRETLQRAAQRVRGRSAARVLYGDTDSLFVELRGASRADAFRIGREIAEEVTADNPAPVTLNFEKVYQPCILQTKKRYVGYMYESPDQKEPVFEAKGIETVRRDGCPTSVKVLHRALNELFTSGDMSRVKRIVCDVLHRVMLGVTPPCDLVFTREYHGPNGYRPAAAAPPLYIANRLSSVDKRRTPRTGERVAWCVVAGPARTPLLQLARSPRELALRPQPLHVQYYVTRVILPPLHRCLSILGADVFKWWNEMNYKRESQVRVQSDSGITRYMSRERCVSCGGAAGPLCQRCGGSAAVTAARSKALTHIDFCYQICSSCCGHAESFKCENTECPVFWRKITAERKYTQIQEMIAHIQSKTKSNIDF